MQTLEQFVDADATYQGWGYKKQKGTADVTAKATAGSFTCAVANLTPQVVGPCSSTHGQSVF